jgi:hypothetical protein
MLSVLCSFLLTLSSVLRSRAALQLENPGAAASWNNQEHLSTSRTRGNFPGRRWGDSGPDHASY